MDMKKFKLGIGPMSELVLDHCLSYSSEHSYPLMIIASRNQVDAKTGYAFTAESMVNYIKRNPHYSSDNVLICRDHCGPYFSDLDSTLSLSDALNRCFETIDEDCRCGFDLIHIDVSRVEESEQYNVARILFDRALNARPDIFFEFGTEDNTGKNLNESVLKLQQQLNFVEKYKPNIKFLVSQTGSLTRHKQVGNFSIESNVQISNLIHKHGLLFKEHNADYLVADEVKLRKQAGVDSINIAPQLGAIQSKTILNFKSINSVLFNDFYKFVLESGYWKKWITPDVTDEDVKFIVAAHYSYNSTLGQKILSEWGNHDDFKNSLKRNIYAALDEYRIGYN